MDNALQVNASKSEFKQLTEGWRISDGKQRASKSGRLHGSHISQITSGERLHSAVLSVSQKDEIPRLVQIQRVRNVERVWSSLAQH
jgi:hypothetical protein